ncbi:MAG: NUDIX hydrolase [Candidatus Bathyarchaeia archaeon]|jgi:ADP-ribose pyrophosphatase
MKKWKQLNSEPCYASRFVSVFNDTVMLPTGKQIMYTTLKLQDYVSVLPVVGNKIVMINILRYPRNSISLEIPSGHIEEGETPQDSAMRELAEETGYTAGQLEYVGSFHPVSRSTQTAHLFFATDLKAGKQNLEENEQITVKIVDIAKIPELLANGDVTHAPTVLALQKFLLTKKPVDQS